MIVFPPLRPYRCPPEVSRKLVISLRDADSMPAGVVRAYVSELYQEVYDQACAARRPDLDVRVLLPPAGASGGGVAGGEAGPQASPFTFNPGPPPPAEGYNGAPPGAAGGREFTVDLVKGWATREVVELDPALEVLFSDEPRDGDRVETINAGRRLAGYPALQFFSLESVASGAYKAEYFYAENPLASIPTFSSVSEAAGQRDGRLRRAAMWKTRHLVFFFVWSCRA